MANIGMTRRMIGFATLAVSMMGSQAAMSGENDESARADRYARGVETAGKIMGAQSVQALLDNFKEISPELAKFTLEFAYGDVVSRPALNLCSRELVTVGALTALGSYPALLKGHINGALKVGCKPEEIVEVILQMSVYAGFPASITAMNVAKDVYREKGITPRKE